MAVAKKSHLVKALTWRIIGASTTTVLALIFGLPQKAIGLIFFADLLIKFVLYYIHERIWYSHIRFGISNSNQDK